MNMQFQSSSFTLECSIHGSAICSSHNCDRFLPGRLQSDKRCLLGVSSINIAQPLILAMHQSFDKVSDQHLIACLGSFAKYGQRPRFEQMRRYDLQSTPGHSSGDLSADLTVPVTFAHSVSRLSKSMGSALGRLLVSQRTQPHCSPADFA